MEHQNRYEAIFRLALAYAKTVAELSEGGDVIGMRAALSYVGMVAAQYSQVSGKEFDVRYTISHGEHGAHLRLYNTSEIRRSSAMGDELPANGSCRQLYENSPLFELLRQSKKKHRRKPRRTAHVCDSRRSLKKIAVAFLTDRRNWEKIAVALFAVLLLFLLPILSVEAIFQADFDWDSPELVSAVLEELDVGSLGFLETSNNILTLLQTALKEAGFGFDEFRKAQALYWLALSPFSEESDFIEKLVAASPQTRPMKNWLPT